MKIAIKGIGVTGGFGSGLTDLEHALSKGYSPIGKKPIKTKGCIFELSAYAADTKGLESFIPKKALRRVDHFSKMALLGCYLALEDAGFLNKERNNMGLVVATGYGATNTNFMFMDSFLDHGDAGSSPTLFSSSVHNAAAANISIMLHITGPNLTISQFDMSFASALLSACMLLQDDDVDTVIVGGVDEYCDVLGYCWQRFFFPDIKKYPEKIRPFEFQNQTALPGEGSAFFLLAREDSKKTGYGFIEDIYFASEAEKNASIPEDAFVFIGADGNRCSGSAYQKVMDSLNEKTMAYSPLYGSLPVGQAFDLAIAALCLKQRKIFVPPENEEESCNPQRESRSIPLNNNRIICLKADRFGDMGTITIGA